MRPSPSTGPWQMRHGPAPAPRAEEPDHAVVTYLRALFGRCSGELVEVRFRREGGMGQVFFETGELAEAARVVVGLGARTDVYVGVAPRHERRGGRTAIRAAWAAWADCDSHESKVALQSIQPAPTMVIKSGSEHGRHAYWVFDTPVAIATVEDLNRRLAVRLGADLRSADGARILRPPTSLNLKYDPPGEVVLQQAAGERHALSALAAALPAFPHRVQRVAQPAAGARDPLRTIDPEVYVRALLGVDVPRSRKIRCPFHDDRTPSLHVYKHAEQGWYCFGCGRGTSIYDMAAATWQLDTRGADFVELKERLTRLFGLDRG